MLLCYIDEAGDTGSLKSATDTTQPVLVIAAAIFDYTRLHAITADLIDLKSNLFPGLMKGAPLRLDRIRPEIKGSEIRNHVGRGNRGQRRHAIRFLDEFMTIMKQHGVRIVARIWIKGIGEPCDGRSVYTSSIQAIYTYFQAYLTAQNDYGMIVADSRTKGLNVPVSHSVFTQKFRAIGDLYDRIYELPTFAHSETHAGLQLCDLLASGLLFPISTFAYCSGHVTNVHVQPRFEQLWCRYGSDLRAMQYRYQDARGKWSGGLTVADTIGHRPGGLLFPPAN